MIGKSCADEVVCATVGTVEGRWWLGRVSTGGEMVETLGTHYGGDPDSVGPVAGVTEWGT